jgi:hypothetical protein
MGSTPGCHFLFHSAAMLLLYIIQRIAVYFSKSVTAHRCMTLLSVALMSMPLASSFVRHAGITDGSKLKSTILG